MKYRVNPDFTFGSYDEYKEGDVVELTPEQASGFLDKLTLIEDDKDVAPKRGKAASKKADVTE
jgi:hypothetical protein